MNIRFLDNFNFLLIKTFIDEMDLEYSFSKAINHVQYDSLIFDRTRFKNSNNFELHWTVYKIVTNH